MIKGGFMTWYVASVIMSIKKLSGKQKNIPVYENFILVESECEEQAINVVKEQARKEVEINSDGLLLDKQPTKMVFEGIRKLITISNPTSMDLDLSPPCTGTELTYSEYVIRNKRQMKQLVKGKPVKLKYID